MRWTVASLAMCGILAVAPAASAAEAWGPLAPANPFLGPLGTSTMHGDAGSSDATPLAGPGTRRIGVDGYPLVSTCPTILQGKDELVLGLCTSVYGHDPTVFLIEPRGPDAASFPLASLRLTKGAGAGDMHAFLDREDRLVVIDGSRKMLRIGHTQHGESSWKLGIEETTDLSSAIPADDRPAGLVPDWQGNVWFATAQGRVGIVKPDGGEAKTIQLPEGEQVANSLSSVPSGRVAIASTHALYELKADKSGQPQILWRAEYDRGPARKPGQLSWGTGSTPTYFGPSNGADYVSIVDNADAAAHLMVFRSGSGEPVCSHPVLTQGGPGSENPPVAIGRSAFVTSTYGYPYPADEPGTAPAEPSSAPFVGGMTRVDVADDGTCHTVWDNTIRSSVVPRLSIADGNLYTLMRIGADETTPLDDYKFAVLNPDTGAVKAEHPLSGAIVADTLQMSPLITKNGVVMQGTATGIMRVR